jgi:hypothetical protein
LQEPLVALFGFLSRQNCIFVHILEVEIMLHDLENIKIKGKNTPKPIKTWAQVFQFVLSKSFVN